MSRAAREIELQMPSRRESVAPTVDRVMHLVDDLGLSESRLHDFSVALSEALSNAAVHGNGLNPARDVTLRLEIEPGRRLVAQVTDHGSGFDEVAVGDPTHPDSVLRDSGRGLFLMRSLADEVAFNDAGNVLRLTFSLAATEGQEGR